MNKHEGGLSLLTDMFISWVLIGKFHCIMPDVITKTETLA